MTPTSREHYVRSAAAGSCISLF